METVTRHLTVWMAPILYTHIIYKKKSKRGVCVHRCSFLRQATTFFLRSLHIYILTTDIDADNHTHSRLTFLLLSLALLDVCRTGGMKEETEGKEEGKNYLELEERSRTHTWKAYTVIKQSLLFPRSLSEYFLCRNVQALNKKWCVYVKHGQWPFSSSLIDDIDTHGANLLYCGISFNLFHSFVWQLFFFFFTSSLIHFESKIEAFI